MTRGPVRLAVAVLLGAFCAGLQAPPVKSPAATPGVDFDPQRGNRYLRFSFAGPESEMAEAARRLKAWL